LIPPELVAPFYTKNGITTQANISGKYRKCQDPTCETYITCPYVNCFVHYTALVRKEDSLMKEWK
jgi:hypothetical protein